MGVQARRRRLVQMEETFESLRERRSETGAEPEAETVAQLVRLRGTTVGTKSAPTTPAVVATSRAPSGGRRRKVVILYKRGAEPDESVMRSLRAAIESAGYDVFIDKEIV